MGLIPIFFIVAILMMIEASSTSGNGEEKGDKSDSSTMNLQRTSRRFTEFGLIPFFNSE